jgi:hypothetical protein
LSSTSTNHSSCTAYTNGSGGASGASSASVALFCRESSDGKLQKLNSDIIGGSLILYNEEHAIISCQIKH